MRPKGLAFGYRNSSMLRPSASSQPYFARLAPAVRPVAVGIGEAVRVGQPAHAGDCPGPAIDAGGDSLKAANASGSSVRSLVCGGRRGGEHVRRQPLAQGAAPALAAALVREDAPGDPERPRPQLVVLRAEVEPPPQRGEGLRDHLCRILRLVHSAERVAADRRVQLAVRGPRIARGEPRRS